MSYWDHVKPVQRSRSVDVERIAVKACSLLDEGGEQALTIRAVAQRVGVAAASLYSRVDGVDDVMDLALDHALAQDAEFQAVLAASGGATALLSSHYAHLVAHPWAIAVIARRPPRGLAYLQFSESLCARLVAEGLPEPLATAYAASNYVLGCAATHQASSAEPGAPIDAEVAPVYERLHRTQQRSAEELLRLGLEAILTAGRGW